MSPKKHIYNSTFTKLNLILSRFVFCHFNFYSRLMIFFFSSEIIAVILLFVGDDMQYKFSLCTFIQQILIEPLLCTRHYSRHSDDLSERK